MVSMSGKVIESTFRKSERLCKRKRIELLFGAGSRSLAAYPLRAVYMVEERAGEPVEVLVSVPKRLFRRAVDRNRLKRLIREAYRHNKHIIRQALADRHIAMSFLWISNEMASFETVESKVRNLLQRISEEI